MNLKAPRYTSYEEVEIDIRPEDLEGAGWIYVGPAGSMTETATTVDKVIAVVADWHNQEHTGSFRWCPHQLCDSIRGRRST